MRLCCSSSRRSAPCRRVLPCRRTGSDHHHAAGPGVHRVLPPRQRHRAGAPRSCALGAAGPRVGLAPRGDTSNPRCGSHPGGTRSDTLLSSVCSRSSRRIPPRCHDGRPSRSSRAWPCCSMSRTLPDAAESLLRSSRCSGRPTSSGSSGLLRPTRHATASTTCRAWQAMRCQPCWRSCATSSAMSAWRFRPMRGRCVSARGSVATVTATRTSRQRVEEVLRLQIIHGLRSCRPHRQPAARPVGQ